MPISISIEPSSSCLDMYDDPDTSSAYSLSGHVSMKYTPSVVFGLAKQPSQDLFLTSLELTFEGQSELIVHGVGYVPLRIFTLTKELVSAKHPIPVTSESQNAEWRVVFNLAIPGWLPSTCLLGDDDEKHLGGVTYGLTARARFLTAVEMQDSLSSSLNSSGSKVWSNLRSVVRRHPHKPRAVHADYVPVRITHYISPPIDSEESEDLVPKFPTSTFAVQATPNRSTNLPTDVLRSVQLHAIVPSRISMTDELVPLTIRLRCKHDNSQIRNNLKVYSLETDVVQVEKYHTSPSPAFVSRFPLPSPSEQPPNVPLRAPHNHLGNLFDFGLVATPSAEKLIPRERSLVPSNASRTFKARGPDGEPQGARFEDGWVRMDVDIPVVGDFGEAKNSSKHVTTNGPLLEIQHQMRIRVIVGYEHRNTTLMDELAFVVPLDFVNVSPKAPSSFGSSFCAVSARVHGHSRRLSSTSPIPIPRPQTTAIPNTRGVRSPTPQSRSSTSSSRPSTPYLSNHLPPYNQLYTENGHRRDEFRYDLPAYCEKESPRLVIARGPSSSSSSFDNCPSLHDSPASTPDSVKSLDAHLPLGGSRSQLQNETNDNSRSRRMKYRERPLPPLEDSPSACHPRRNGLRRPLSDLLENDVQYGTAL